MTEEVCTEIVMLSWPAVSVLDTFRSYIAEHVIPRGGDIRRTCIGMKSWIEAEVTHKDAATITRADGRLVVQYDITRGVKPATARRNMAMGIAALNHAKREERIKSVPKFQIPEASSPRLRWFTEEEVGLILRHPKPGRIQRFILLAVHTGVRSRAIEELTWDRVNFQARTIDFRVPGKVYRNKKRPIAPINDALLPRLQSMYERRTDDYVIGLGPHGACSCTYEGVRLALEECGICEPGVARHVFRHTFCSWRVQAGFSYAHVGALVGDTAAMIEQVYGHLSPHHLLAASNMDRSILRVA